LKEAQEYLDEVVISVGRHDRQYSCEDFSCVEVARSIDGGSHYLVTQLVHHLQLGSSFYSAGVSVWNDPPRLHLDPLRRPIYVEVDKNVPSSAVTNWNPSGTSNLGVSEDEWKLQGWTELFSQV
jgi:hypothetical protein